MPSILKLGISDSTIPALNHRRVWADPEVRSHSLVVLTLTRLHLAPPAVVPPAAEVVAAIEQGDHSGGLGPDAVVIDLATVRRVRLDMLANAVAVEFRCGDETAAVTVRFAGPESADALFTKLWHRLGANFQLIPFRVEPWAAVRGPVLVLAGLLAGTAVAAAGMAAADAGRFGPLSLPGWADWRVACAVGGAAMAAAQLWMYRRWTEPPARLELVRAAAVG